MAVKFVAGDVKLVATFDGDDAGDLREVGDGLADKLMGLRLLTETPVALQ